jgi:predicted kinase
MTILVARRGDYVAAAYRRGHHSRYPECVWTQAEIPLASVSSQAPPLVLLVGPPGVGKSTLATALSGRTGLTIIESDDVRRALFADPSYSKAESGRVFDVVHAAVEDRLAKGAGTIVDATNLVEAERAVFYGIGRRLGARLIVVRLTAVPRVVRERLRRRSLEEGAGPAGVDVYERMRAIRQRIKQPHLVVDTTAGIETAVEAVLREIEG